MQPPEYRYHASTWGGFYNEEFKKIHGLSEGDFIFKTKAEREAFVKCREKIEVDLNARVLCFCLTEGFCCDIHTILHRVVEFNRVRHYSSLDLGINYPFSAARYHLEDKWRPGFNDYPLGENFDYGKIKIISEWITGAWQDS